MQLKQMEDAAMKAYALDISRGGDITTQQLNATVAAATADYEDEVATASTAAPTHRTAPGPSAIPRRAIDPLLPPIDVLEDEERAKKAKMYKRKAAGPPGTEAKEESMWVEAKTDEGHTYYWHVKSGGKQLKSINFLFALIFCPKIQFFRIICRKCLGGTKGRLYDNRRVQSIKSRVQCQSRTESV